MKNKSRFLFLYTELATYFTSCINELSKVAEIHVVRYPINSEAPFNFNLDDSAVHFYERRKFNRIALQELVETISPDIIFCSGWIDKDYLKICKNYFNRIPTVLCMDTKWIGSFRQRIASYLSGFIISNKFSHAWVPGDSQFNFAQKLGINKANIQLGYYCADTTIFNNYYGKHKNFNGHKFPKRFLYVGRYYDFKGVVELWKAFIQLQNEKPSDWELWCLGNGDIKPIEHPKIKHLGFLQPNQLDDIIANTGVFILPSNFEPWGVVVHEYAAAGYPLLLSSQVGANELFLEENKNGYTFKAKDILDLKEKLNKFILLNEDNLILMSNYSHSISQKLTIEKWCATAQQFLKNEN